jgi:hypothetical protein
MVVLPLVACEHLRVRIVPVFDWSLFDAQSAALRHFKEAQLAFDLCSQHQFIHGLASPGRGDETPSP